MKRERINTAETELMTGSLDVSVYNMEKNLQAAVEKINELFGTDIKVYFNEEIKEEEVEPDEAPEAETGEETSTEEPATEETKDEKIVEVEETKKEEGVKDDE